LTLFYFVMSVGGALGGVFTALLAPLLFDWAWEHPLLIVAAAALLPPVGLFDWRRLPGLTPEMARFAGGIVLALAALFAWFLHDVWLQPDGDTARWLLSLGMALCGMLLIPWRWAYMFVLAMLLLAQGGLDTVEISREGLRQRSYFGIYTVRYDPNEQMRMLTHGTTLHGQQSTDPTLRHLPLTYYGPGSGAGIALANSGALFGPAARIGVVGLGTGSLACYHERGQKWLFFEIDPLVLEYSRNRTFTYLTDCAPDAKIVLGDARLGLARTPRGSLDILAVDAFSSDAIPLHLLTDEAFGVYLDALSPRGLLLVHISNRFIELEPVLAAEARHRGLTALVRDDVPPENGGLTASSWVIMSRDPAQFGRLAALAPALPLTPLKAAAPRAWTDDHASILPYLRWRHLLLKH
jgi:SAM-dependent methyltransferase